MLNRVRQLSGNLPAVDVDALLRQVNRYLPIRHRHVLTRNNGLRLRVFALPCVGMAVMGLMSVAVLSNSTSARALQVADAGPVVLGPSGQDEDRSLFERLAFSQKRLQRSMDDASEAERLAMIDPAAGPISKQVIAEDATPVAKAPEGPQEKTVKIGSGDTLTCVLSRAG